MCLRRGCSREDALDIVQEAYTRALRYQLSEKVRDLDSLLRRIVINISITEYHQRRTSPIVRQSICRLDRYGLLIDPKPGPERTLGAEQDLDRIVNLVSAVSRRTCQIFIEQRSGYSYEEIGAAFVIKPRTVEKHLTTALMMLKEKLREEVCARAP